VTVGVSEGGTNVELGEAVGGSVAVGLGVTVAVALGLCVSVEVRICCVDEGIGVASRVGVAGTIKLHAITAKHKQPMMSDLTWVERA